VARYTYGDSTVAAQRLALVAATFDPVSRGFIRAAARAARSWLAVDLGCGPGHTTQLLHHVTGAARTVGLDASASYVELARASAPPGVSFEVHDVRVVPFPTGPCDILYARLLLAHLPDPGARVHDWASQLQPGGIALLDDLETIDTDDPEFRTYLDEVALAVIRRQGGALFVGPILHAMPDPPDTERVHDAVATFAPPAAVTARIFGMNLQVLTDRGEVEPQPEIADALRAIAEGTSRAQPVEWSMRQIALRKPNPRDHS
jgi:SAM-dependent methyltransferase